MIFCMQVFRDESTNTVHSITGFWNLTSGSSKPHTNDVTRTVAKLRLRSKFLCVPTNEHSAGSVPARSGKEFKVLHFP